MGVSRAGWTMAADSPHATLVRCGRSGRTHRPQHRWRSSALPSLGNVGFPAHAAVVGCTMPRPSRLEGTLGDCDCKGNTTPRFPQPSHKRPLFRSSRTPLVLPCWVDLPARQAEPTARQAEPTQSHATPPWLPTLRKRRKTSCARLTAGLKRRDEWTTLRQKALL